MLARLLGWLDRLRTPRRGGDSPWERVTMEVPTRAFGPGSTREFRHYLEGESLVSTESIDDIVEWLLTCEYVTDVVQFNERDLWQHPRSFEERRRGDCEDFALWAWRKLREIGVDAEFVVGRVVCSREDEDERRHAWVVYRVNGTAFLFEPAARSRERMIQLLDEAMHRYMPHFAVNHQLTTCAFLGCLL
jgi:Bacterial transglutaminase-like cysteine proteinase BTLCP